MTTQKTLGRKPFPITMRPSSSERWMHCPASALLEFAVGEVLPAGEHAARGTTLHAVAQWCIDNDTLNVAKACNALGVKLSNADLSVVSGYLNELVGLAELFYIDKLHAEQRVELFSDAIMRVAGTADLVGLSASGKTALLCDLKTGAVPVSLQSSQLEIYAAALVFAFPEVERIVVAIYQPAAWDGENALRYVVHDDARSFAVNVMQRVMDAASRVAAVIFDALNYGRDAVRKHCKPSPNACAWCNAAHVCPAIDAAIEGIQKICEPQTLGNKRLGELLNARAGVERVFATVTEIATQRMTNGEEVPGCKLVLARRKPPEKWTDEKQVVALLAQQGVLQNVAKPPTPAQARKLDLPDDVRAQLDDMTTRAPQPQDVVAVPQDDRRKEVSPNVL